MAVGTCFVFDPALHRHHWRYHERRRLQVHTVCHALLAFINCSLTHQHNRLSLSQVGEGGSLAEEVFGTVRTAQAFSRHKLLSGLYNTRMDKSLKFQVKSAIFRGAGMGVMNFCIYSNYALSQSRNSTSVFNIC